MNVYKEFNDMKDAGPSSPNMTRTAAPKTRVIEEANVGLGDLGVQESFTKDDGRTEKAGSIYSKVLLRGLAQRLAD